MASDDPLAQRKGVAAQLPTGVLKLQETTRQPVLGTVPRPRPRSPTAGGEKALGELAADTGRKGGGKPSAKVVASMIAAWTQTYRAASAREPPRFLAGTIVDHYELIRPLVQGGMDHVVLARDTHLGRLVAVKLLLDAHRNARFLVEARAAATLAHESIVAIHDIAEHDGVPYLVLEYVKGKTLAAWLRARAEAQDADTSARRAGLSARRAAELMLPVARALVCAHAAGVVHRGLKPSNIMLAESGVVKVLDFGVAKLLGEGVPVGESPVASAGVTKTEEDAAASSLARTNAQSSTLAYLSPEQWSADVVDERADLWAVGILLYELVAGAHPLSVLSAETLATVANLDEPMPSVRELWPDLGQLGAVIDRCLVKRRTDRLASARELCAELEAVAHAQPEPQSVTGEGDNPFAGLAPFQERDAARFFGREHAITQAVARLEERPLLAVVGPPGAGKSSLVRAGLIPALKCGGDVWEAFILRPGLHPLAEFAELLLQHGRQRSISNGRGAATVPTAAPVEESPPGDAAPLEQGARDEICEQLRREPGFFGAELRDRARRRLERILVFVDQFEEVQTIAAEDERDAFLSCLTAAADDASSPLRIVVSVRQDFVDRAAGGQSELAELMSRGTLLVGPMERSDLQRAMVKPAELAEHRFESDALLDEMLDAVAGTAGALPLLQFTAARLWEERDREQKQLTEVSYRAMGGVSGALAGHADSALAAMSEVEQRCARALLLRLVTPERTRALVTRRDLTELAGVTEAELDRVLGQLIDARLVTVDESAVELVHESLITTWSALMRWLEDEQDDAQFRARLRHAAKEWEASGRTEGLLWRGEAAQETALWQTRQDGKRGASLSAREARYLAAVGELATRKQRRRRRTVTGTMVCLSAMLVLGSGLAIHARRQAKRAEQQSALAERQTAQAEQQSARSDAEATEAQRSAARARDAVRMTAARAHQEDPTTMLALLREIELSPAPRGWSELARWAVEAGVAETLLLREGGVGTATFSPDGRRIASALADQTVRVWNADGTGQSVVLRGHGGRVFAAAWSPDGQRIVSASADKTMRVWYADGSGEPVVLRGEGGQVLVAAFSPDGQHIASASEDNAVRVWNVDGTGEPIRLRGHEGRVNSVAWSLDGRRVVAASEDATVRVWVADGTGRRIVLRGHTEPVNSAAWSPDGRSIVSASEDRTVRVWRADGRGDPRSLPGSDAVVYSASWSPDGRRIVSVLADKTVHVQNADGRGQLLVLRGHKERVSAAEWSVDSRHIFSASADQTVRVWRAEDTSRPLVLRGHGDGVNAAGFSPDNGRVASASADKTVRVWNADGTGQLVALRGHDEGVNSVAWSPDGRRVASASADKTVRVWNADGTGDPLVLRGHRYGVNAAAWSPDGLHLASASEDKTVRVWNADGTGDPLVLRGHDGAVYTAAWSPDGLHLVSASEDKTVRVWNADGKGEPLVLRGHDEKVIGAAFTPDGRHLVSASADKTIRVWNADGAGEPLVLRGHDASIDLSGDRPVSPDGARLVSGSYDGTLRIWNADGAGEPLVLRAPSPSKALNSASWSPDGKRIVAASDDRTVVVWSDVEPLPDAEAAKLWTATTYCMPMSVRQRLLDLPEEQSRADLGRCERRVQAVRAAGTTEH